LDTAGDNDKDGTIAFTSASAPFAAEVHSECGMSALNFGCGTSGFDFFHPIQPSFLYKGATVPSYTLPYGEPAVATAAVPVVLEML